MAVEAAPPIPRPTGSRSTKSSRVLLIFAGVFGAVIFVGGIVSAAVVLTGRLDGSSSSPDSRSTGDVVLPTMTLDTNTSTPSLRPVTARPSVKEGSPTMPPTTASPTKMATAAPTAMTTIAPTKAPIRAPTEDPTMGPTAAIAKQTSTFYAIGDIPYSAAVILKNQMMNLPADAEFVIHVGDLRNSGEAPNFLPCRRSEYEDAASRLRESHAPVFVILGDNDWTDCPNRRQGLRYWQETFLEFETKFWNHTFDIKRQPERPDNFAFVHKGTLYMGLNIIGGEIHNRDEWETRLSDQSAWTIEQINSYASLTTGVGRVVIFGHANPNHRHRDYFVPLRDYIDNELQNQIPILYVNGDKHEWEYTPSFYEQESFLRIMVSGKGVDPPLKISVEADGQYRDPGDAFEIDRS